MTSSAGAASSSQAGSKELADLESEILTTLETVARLDEFAADAKPDNRYVQHNLDALVKGLGQVHAASAQTVRTVPTALVREFVDAGRPLDEFAAQQREGVDLRVDLLDAKRSALARLRQRILTDGADLLAQLPPPS